MGRLVKATLYRIDESRRKHTYPGDWNDCGGIWKRAAKRIREIDPEGDESLALLRELEKMISK